jgi:hypothetical protein
MVAKNWYTGRIIGLNMKTCECDLPQPSPQQVYCTECAGVLADKYKAPTAKPPGGFKTTGDTDLFSFMATDKIKYET